MKSNRNSVNTYGPEVTNPNNNLTTKYHKFVPTQDMQYYVNFMCLFYIKTAKSGISVLQQFQNIKRHRNFIVEFNRRSSRWNWISCKYYSIIINLINITYDY